MRLTAILLLASTVVADDQPFDKVPALLTANCVKCHGPEKQEGNLRLDSLAAAKEGGDLGPAVVPGDIEKSRLIEAIRYENGDLQMPPRGKLPDEAIELLTKWIKAGAPWNKPVK